MAQRENGPALSRTESRDVQLGPDDLHLDLHLSIPCPLSLPPSPSFLPSLFILHSSPPSLHAVEFCGPISTTRED